MNASVLIGILVLCTFSYVECVQPGPFRPGGVQRNLNNNNNNKVWCTHDSLLIYHDCRICVCPKPNRIAKCFKKSCDLRTKDGGQCPSAILRMDDNKLCQNSVKSACGVDKDCPGQQLCCFDFCRGTQCMEPVPLDPGSNVHGGRGYE